ncbi:CheR family methyltransferase [Gynuella sunshinyii]|uniref:protein-glutamate O-methyltransferase n=1 Tax=Gynuella sunshinyii YC6258 TaxID=1445510 RepID=A0A0C5VBU3_9GAMM|nr:protein-glutamate O-methyltransferase CheR [Gynuella sunshinyii]AJQ96795.1 methylase of chemotaxis methyl-accepting protein [Gynuella sunshinyii YC6258]
MSATEKGYAEFARFLETVSGISLGDNKQYLVTSRLRNILKEHHLSSLEELLVQVKNDIRGQLRTKVIDAMTTNETLWFRDMHPFDILKRVILPEHFAQVKGRPLRIWSAACSSGQEPYSIAFTLEEWGKSNPGKISPSDKIIATDISSSVLAEAKQAEYPMLSLGRGLDTPKINQYFTKVSEGRWKVKPEYTRKVEFRALNLKDSYAGLGKFDIVFCRNVLIYFTGDLKKDILTRIHGTLRPGGFLVVGASESVGSLQDKYEMVHCRPGIIYRAI